MTQMALDDTMNQKDENFVINTEDEEETSLHDENRTEELPSTVLLFDPLKSLLSDIINEIKQMKKQNQDLTEQLKNMTDLYGQCKNRFDEQTEKTKDLQTNITELREQNELQLDRQSKQNNDLQHAINQLTNQSQQQLTDQRKQNDEVELTINQLKEKDAECRTDISQLRADGQHQKTQVLESEQRHKLLEMNVKGIRSYLRYIPGTPWKQNGITIAGGNSQGNQSNQLHCPFGISMDDDQIIYVADWGNHRIVEWKYNATEGRIVVGENGQGDQINQLNGPTDVIIDQETSSLIIADRGNRRVMRWSRQNNANAEVIITDVDCTGLTMDEKGSVYVSDGNKGEVRRWRKGEKGKGTIVAGGNGPGDRLNQLNFPTFLFVDDDESVYVSDYYNHRVMKWVKDGREGVVVAGGHGEGDSLRQLAHPQGILVDQFGHIYVADCSNHRVVRWGQGAGEGTIIVGGNRRGKQSNQLNLPSDLSFDRQGNIYVADWGNERIQKFENNYDQVDASDSIRQ